MKVKCQWITCTHNSSNQNSDKTGYCECPNDEVNFVESDGCEACGYDVDALVCNDYMYKK